MADESIFQHDGQPRTWNMGYMDQLQRLMDMALRVLEKKNDQYADSWKRRGGVGAFMMLARKWDRIEKQVYDNEWDVFKAIREDKADRDNLLDDIRDLRNYLTLVEHEVTYGDEQRRTGDAGQRNPANNETVGGDATINSTGRPLDWKA